MLRGAAFPLQAIQQHQAGAEQGSVRRGTQAGLPVSVPNVPLHLPTQPERLAGGEMSPGATSRSWKLGQRGWET